ncbi:MAG: hypothetical protein JSS70_01390 [Bacteroidetes bacterium]|nr:hypothetical protein [Bacteroidota bacterium]
MNTIIICQSCTMPIDRIDDKGIEKDGSNSNIYCKYCNLRERSLNPF